MYAKNNAGKDALWEAEQKGNEEMVGWMLAYGEEKVVGNVTEGDADEITKESLEEPTGEAKTTHNANSTKTEGN
jgi:hypothetical protein